MKKGDLFSRIVFLLWVLLATAGVQAQVGDLPRSTPEQQGLSSAGVQLFLDSLFNVPQTNLHHVMVLRHGTVIAETHPRPFRADYTHTIFSASKTFVALAVGAAIDDNRLRLTDRVTTFFPERLPDSISARLAAMTVRDLLTMASGIECNYSQLRDNNDDWVRAFLASEPAHDPGSFFYYDSMCSYMLSAIVQRVTGKTLLDYLQEKFFEPMNINVAEWEQCPEGINTGGWGLRVQAETEAKLGILLLNRGKWNGRQLVSAKWIDEATTKQIECKPENTPPTDGNQGYCYQIWRSKYPGSYRADGAFAQYVACVPQYDLTVVINSISWHGHDLLGCIWDQLIPAIKSDEPIAPDGKAFDKLQKFCDNAQIAPVKGKAASKQFKKLATGDMLTITPQGQQPMTIEATADGLLLSWTYDGHTINRMPLAFNRWATKNISPNLPLYTIGARNRFSQLSRDFLAAGTYAWTSPSQLTMTVYYVNWISARTITVDFDARTVSVNDNFSPRRTDVIKW